MLHAEEGTTFIGLAELRKESPKLLKEIQKCKVVLTKRNRPVGVILDYQDYERLENLMDLLEDIALGYEAKARMSLKKSKWIPLPEAKKRIGLR